MNTQPAYKNAFVSAFDKSGLYPFLSSVKGLRIVSTGGTARHLREKGLSIKNAEEETRFPEALDGRVKSLHPHIYIPLLARTYVTEDRRLLKQNGLIPFDLLICNLYPFASKTHLKNDKELAEWIDVGGPSLLRAGAKNYFSVTVLCSPSDYSAVQNGSSLIQRKRLAAKAFRLLSKYDELIAETLMREEREKRAGAAQTQSGAKPEASAAAGAPDGKTSVSKSLKSQGFFRKMQTKDENGAPVFQKTLRYGENPHQKAVWLGFSKKGLHQAELLQGKALSFNNVLDLQAATDCIRDFHEPSAVAVKHNSPCGLASCKTPDSALKKALEADPESVFGGITALNRPLTEDCALALQKIFIEGLIAPDFSPGALKVLSKKRNLRILKWPEMLSFPANEEADFKRIDGGALQQSRDCALKIEKEIESKGFENVLQITGAAPDENIKRDLIFAWKAAAHLKSNGAALVRDRQTLGLGMGQVNRADAVRQALFRFKKFHAPNHETPNHETPNHETPNHETKTPRGGSETRPLVLAGDGFFPFADSVEEAASAGVQWIIQPGGSIRDREITERAKQLKINMVLTGVRHFKH